MKCKICNQDELINILDLAKSPPSNAYLKNQHSTEHYSPLRLLFCKECKLPQLEQYHTSNQLFTPEYAYESSVSKQWLAHCQLHVTEIMNRHPKGSKVLEIASNDGYLLQYFSDDYICLGVEPSNMAKIALSKGINTVQKFLTSKTAEEIKAEFGVFDVLLAKNVFAHVPDLIDFAQGAVLLMNDEAELIIEVPSFFDLLADMSFDTVYHEHYYYHTINSIISMGEKVGLKLCNIKKLSTHGGSYRASFVKQNNKCEVNSKVINELISLEASLYSDNHSKLSNLQEKAFSQKLSVLENLIKLKKKNLSVAAFGAAAKGNTILNYCGINNDLIECVFDNSIYKQNLFLPGSGIPIKPLTDLHNIRPDVIILLPWNLQQELKHTLRDEYSFTGPIMTLMPKFMEI